MTDLLRLATELERSGGMHRLTALIQCAVRVAWEREHATGAGMSDRVVTVRGERWPPPVTESNSRPCWTDAPHFSQRGADCQSERPTSGITHAADSAIYSGRQRDLQRPDAAVRSSDRGGWRVNSDNKRPRAFVCGTDWQHELGDAPDVTLYATIEDLRAAKKCLDACGIVEVEVRLVAWHEPPDRDRPINPEDFGDGA